jgi:hypothetical protein
MNAHCWCYFLSVIQPTSYEHGNDRASCREGGCWVSERLVASQEKLHPMNFVFPLFAVFMQLQPYINVHTSSSLFIQHYMFRPNWSSLDV